MVESHYHIEQVFSNQLEKQVFQVKSTLTQESKRLERLNSQLHLTRQQLNSYSEQSQKIQQSLLKCFSSFTNQTCQELREIKAPVSCLSDLCDKFLLILNIQDRSWKNFRNISKNFLAFKDLMFSLHSYQLPEPIINEALPLWKSREKSRQKLRKISESACILLDWVCLVIEHNIKLEIILSSKKRIPKLEKMIKKQSKTLSDLTSESICIEELVTKTKLNIEDNDTVENYSELSLTSTPYSFSRPASDDKTQFHSTSHLPAAPTSAEASKAANPHSLTLSFPNFNSPQLYFEIPGAKKPKPNSPIVFEDKSLSVSCCSLNLFCF